MMRLKKNSLMKLGRFILLAVAALALAIVMGVVVVEGCTYMATQFATCN